MTPTKAITQRLNAKQKLTKAQKIKVLTDARDLLADPKRWTQGTFAATTDHDGEVMDGLRYVPSKVENTAMCVMGAVAVAAGLSGKAAEKSSVYGSFPAMHRLAACSIGAVMLEALPKSKAPKQSCFFDRWVGSECWLNDISKITSKPFDSDWDMPTEEMFQKWLKLKKLTAIEWFVEAVEGDALDWVFNYNDDDRRTHKDMLKLLDRAINNLKAK